MPFFFKIVSDTVTRRVGTVEADGFAGEFDEFRHVGRLEMDVFRDIDVLGAGPARHQDAAGQQEKVG